MVYSTEPKMAYLDCAMSAFTVTIDRPDGTPAYRQIADRVREAISAGQLQPNDRLPSARSLAAQLGLARGTVDTAYALLAGEGYVQGRGPGWHRRLAACCPRPRRAQPRGRSPSSCQGRWRVPCPFASGCRRSTPSLAPCGPASPPAPLGRPGRPNWPIPIRPASRSCANRSPPICGRRAASPAAAPTVFITAGFQGALALIAHAMLGAGRSGSGSRTPAISLRGRRWRAPAPR